MTKNNRKSAMGEESGRNIRIPAKTKVEETESVYPMRVRVPSGESLAVGLLVVVLLIGAVFRFTGLNWDDTYHLHPDERFLTDVASLLRSTDPLTYLKTSESPLNPYNVNRTFYVYGNFPMTVTRLVAEGVEGICNLLTDVCSYNFLYFDGIHLVGRFLSALVDLVSILFTFLIGRRLYNWQTGLIGALLMASAVLPIQQSHFFTMDNWAAALTTMTLYTAVRASEDGTKLRWWLLFGLGLGLTVASRINVAPLAIMAAVAAIIWLVRRAIRASTSSFWGYLASRPGAIDLQRAIFGLLLAALVSIVTFRLAQPYAFADGSIVQQATLSETGQLPGTIETIIGSLVRFNPQWRANLAEIRGLQSPDASFPPALQWTDRAPIIFPLTNMILWGMGLTAGLAAWLGFLWALWRIIRGRPDWTAHALLVSWIGMYFLFMSTRWVKSIRYFLPIYPFLLILAGWALVELWQRAGHSRLKRFGAGAAIVLVIVPTLLWANSFVNIYRHPITRVQASEWMFENVPSGATLLYHVKGAEKQLQLPLRQYDFVPDGPPLVLRFTLPEEGTVKGVRFNYLSDPDQDQADSEESLHLLLTSASGEPILAEGEVTLDLGPQRQDTFIDLEHVMLPAGVEHQIIVEAGPGGAVRAGTSVLANEHWDDSLPVRLNGLDPYFLYYSGLSDGLVPITHPDSDEKRQGFYRWLEEADFIVLSSQRALWSIPRLPTTYPMTIRYYEALFSGDLGFELVNQFHADHQIGPLHISDVGGTVNWGSPADLGWPPPNSLAAEEAFSVYDHPPVWLFAKTEAFESKRVRQVLGEVDLSQVIVMTPGQATDAPNGLMLSDYDSAVQQANGTFSDIFNPDGLLANQPWLAAAVWWIIVVLLGWLAFPVSFLVFNGLPDHAYPLSRIFSLLFISYITWLAASLKWLPNTRSTLIFSLALLTFLSLLVIARRGQEISLFIRRNSRTLLFVEILGLFLFGLFLVIRLGNPDTWDVIWGGEKPMDLSYFNAVLKSTFFPPYDPWYAGGYINYYYYGFVYVGALTKLLGILPEIAYNLILPMLASFTGLGAFSIAFNLVKASQRHKAKSSESVPPPRIQTLISILKNKAIVAGLISAIFIVLLGNLAEIGVVFNAWHQAGNTTINTGIAPVDTLLRTVDGAIDLTLTDQVAPIYPGDWFWNATRAINAEPGEVRPITEFPFFTFLYGDMHAHMIALPLTLLALAWSISMVLQRKESGKSRKTLADHVNSLTKFGVGALVIGVLWATNTWDYPIYLLFGVMAVTYRAYENYGGINLKMVATATGHSVLLVALSQLLFLPFSQSYGTAYESLSLWPGSYTFLTNYLLIYGLFLFLILTHLAREFRAWTNSWDSRQLASWEPFAVPVILGLALYVIVIALLLLRNYWIAPLTLTLATIAGLLSLRPGLPIVRRLPLLLIAAALALTLLVEIIVLDGDIGRMNTVFKFYMQVWTLLSVVSGVIIAWAWPSISVRSRLSRVWQVTFVLLLALSALYPLLATKAKWDIRMSDEAPHTLDGMAYMESTVYQDTAFDGSNQIIALAHDYDAIQWMRRNIQGSPVIAEAHSSNPYRSAANRISMYTGLPAIVGWDWHQRQQRAVLPPTVVSNRIFDVNTLYNTTNIEEAMAIIDQYDVAYVYVGPLESTYYTPQGLLKFEQMVNLGLLEEVYRNDGVTIYEVVV